LSRVVLGVPYPSDVVSGWLLGATWTAAVVVLLLPAGSPNAEPAGGVT
jgi:membrane-associated phospholipid phosphatase